MHDCLFENSQYKDCDCDWKGSNTIEYDALDWDNFDSKKTLLVEIELGIDYY